jgi:hypothetical protein
MVNDTGLDIRYLLFTMACFPEATTQHPTPLTSIEAGSQRVEKFVSLQNHYFSIVDRHGFEASRMGSVFGMSTMRSTVAL